MDTISQREKRDPNLKEISEFVEARSRATNYPIFGKVKAVKAVEANRSLFLTQRQTPGADETVEPSPHRN